MSPPPLLAVTDLACGYRGRRVLGGIGFTLAAGDLLCLLGPNGIGKTTLFKTLLRLLPRLGGEIRLNGRDVAGWTAKRFAAVVGYVPQAHVPPFPFSVSDVVVLGRVAHMGAFAAPSRADRLIATQALDLLGARHLAEEPYTEISGGERQLVLIARALAQSPSLLIMDEPTANLDFGNQLRVLGHIRKLVEDSGLAVVMTTHDPNHALHHATRVAALGRDGRLAVGAPTEVVSAAFLRETYGVSCRLAPTPLPGRPEARTCLPGDDPVESLGPRG
ncbi:ABC transporter protein [Rhodospirillum rubrum F11]|uniref:ABC transporter component n=1 Tax=Rhodospirillum rubrum (strain ATCC 11170 / ATH 1.1.1 / DSM 467 / LMG 4362 / NCIMB 8255 / S1) TaxID=269796 RepID=Q2RPC7_RHORT|nr:ABC transporter ATP-binding protein [Rhodospirillum rubrum]ABC24018.1 ABC transporter component [Rhodospirillum rubrum ATCC 11170]AEO49763.1 ABC transporter protein [Rhodospirillum rubrum F11]QXG79961.1 ABC transporter ATP-binding protein [Rhodospirillum rubrum]